MSIDLLKKTTMKEVATLAGVSLATVDRVLSNRAKVSPHTKERVLEAIQTLNVNQDANQLTRPSSAPHTSPLKFLFLSESGAPFLRSIESAVEAIRDLFTPLHVSMDTKSICKFDLQDFITLISDSAKNYDAIILLCREDPTISAIVNKVIKEGCPIVCLTTDLCDTSRLAYVGINHVSAGRTAGHLMGKYIGQQSGEVILVVSASYRSQYERELGFRRVIREQFPNLRILESLNNHDLDDESYQSLITLFQSGIKPLGIYNITGGTKGVAKALKEKGWSEEVVFIGHELNDASYNLLSQNEVDIIIDQDLRSEVLTAINVLLHHFKLIKRAPVFTPSAPIITLRENMGVRMTPELPSHQESLITIQTP